MSNETTSALAGALRDRYVVERELGRGGMATVYLARDLKHDRAVALKVLHPELAVALGAERFLLEIRLVARLQHPHILPVHDSGEAAGQLWFTMPYVEGKSLRGRLLREGELPIGEAVRLLRDIADALTYAHQHGVVHRDIKPDNVLLSGHHAMVTDFGVAKAVRAADDSSSSTYAGMTLGTPGYMPPEQASGDPNVDHRADIYALGVVAYEILAGQHPFTAPTLQGKLTAQLTQKPPALSTVRPNVPAALEALVMSCLEKRPADRPQSAADFMQQLEAVSTPPAGSGLIQTQSRVPRRIRGMLGAAMIGLAAVVAWLGFRSGSAQPEAVVDPDLVAIMPFRVSGADPSLAYLREGMIELLAVKLTGEGGPRAVNPSALLSAWRAAGYEGRDFSSDSSVMLGRKLGAGRLIEGSVVGSSAHLTLTASLLAASRAAPRVSVDGPLDSLSLLVDRLTAALLAGESATGEQLGQLTTTSLPALRSYLNGRAAYRRGSYKEAVQHFDRALQIDSSFALAALTMTTAAGWCCPAAADKGLRLAWAGRQELSARDRALLVATAGPSYPASSSALARLKAWEHAVDAAPDRPETWLGLGENLFHHGRVLALSSSWERAAEAFRRALEFDSTLSGPLEHLIEYAARSGDTATAARLFKMARSSDSMGEGFSYLRWRMATALGDSSELRRIRASLPSMKDLSLVGIIYIGQYDGLSMEDVRKAVAVMQKRATTRGEREQALYHAWSAAMNSGRLNEGLSVLQSYGEVERDTHVSLYLQILGAIFWGGDTAAATVAARQLSHLETALPSRDRAVRARQLKDRCFLEHWRLYRGDTNGASRTLAAFRTYDLAHDWDYTINLATICSAAIAAWHSILTKSSSANRYLAAFDSLALTGPPGWIGSAGVPDVIPDFQHGSLLLARLFQARGDRLQALGVIRRRHYFLGPPLYLSSYLREEGLLAAALNDYPGAIRAFQHYLALRSDPEASVEPEVRAVKKELARLVGER